MLGDKLLPATKPGFLKSKKMLRFILLYTQKSVSENMCVYNIILNGWCYSIMFRYIIMADVIAMWNMLNHIWCEVGVNLFVIGIGWCFACYISFILADVIANPLW